MKRYFHPGERQIHAEAGTDTDQYEAISQEMMLPAVKENEVRFVESRTFSVAASVDAQGRPWASPLFADLGRDDTSALFRVESPTVVQIAAVPANGDPLVDNVANNGEMGVLYFDPSRRRRAKSLGAATINGDGSIRYEMTRNFGLCPKYIFKRDHLAAPRPTTFAAPSTGTALSAADQQQLAETDTIFFASFFPDHGADATHRGGRPGFVDVISEQRIEIPDYFGNGMFNTIGNLVLDNRIGLMTVDFTTGRTIHLTGTANVRKHDDPHHAADRIVRIDIDEVVVTTANVGTWTDVGASPYSPGLT